MEASLHNAGMEEYGKSSLKDIDLSDLFPSKEERPNNGYASKPVKLHPTPQGLAVNAPAFANLIRLKTLDSNLSLEFSFSRESENVENTRCYSLNSIPLFLRWFLMSGMMLVYDGSCPLCIQAVQKLSNLGFLKGIHAQAWQSLPTRDAAFAEQIKTEFLLIKPNNNQVRGGFEALAYLAVNRFSWTRGLLSMPGVLFIGKILYKIISMNRRVLAPSGNMPCDCDPPFHLGWRVVLWVSLLFILLIGCAVFGISVNMAQPDKSYSETGLQWVLAAGSGWALNFLIFGIVLPKRYLDFVQQCLVVMVIGSFWLMPLALINFFGTLASVSSHVLLKLTLIAIVLNSLMMLRTMSGRLIRLKFPQWAPWLWFALLQSVTIPLFIYFEFFN